MTDERREELAALHALDLLEGPELAEFEAELAADPKLGTRIAELRETAAALCHAAPSAEPPAALKARILASVSESTKAAAPVIPFPSWLPWAVAACFAFLAAGTGRLYWMSRSERALQEKLAQVEIQSARNQMETERLLNRRMLSDARRQTAEEARQVAALESQMRSLSDLARFKITKLASMLGNSPAALAVAVWDPERQQGVLDVSKLPALASDKDYEIWVIDPQYTAPVCCKVFQVDPSSGGARVTFTADKPIKLASRFAVSLERKGGVPEPQGPIVLLSE